jgi:hypothetical protein
MVLGIKGVNKAAGNTGPKPTNVRT